MNATHAATAGAYSSVVSRPAHQAFVALRFAFVVAPVIAGIDKFFNILANWDSYVSPVAAQLLPVPVGTFMGSQRW